MTQHKATAPATRQVTTRGFAILPHQVADTVPQEIKGAVRSVYPALHRHGWGSDEGSWASIKTLMDESGFGRDGVRAALRWLTDEGWVTREERPGYTPRYRVRIEDPQPPKQASPHRKQQGDPCRKQEGGATENSRGPLLKSVGEQEPSNKNPRTRKNQEPPLPPKGGTDVLGWDWPDACSGGTLVADPHPQRPEPAPSPKPKRMAKPQAFHPSPDDIPASLLPVEAALRTFWDAKAGQRTQQAWNCLTGALERIWQHPDGGIEAVRDQLDNAIQAGWRSITFSNWQKYGARPADQFGAAIRFGTAGTRRKSSTEAAADAVIAFYNSMESA
jgi:hypothetical protein